MQRMLLNLIPPTELQPLSITQPNGLPPSSSSQQSPFVFISCATFVLFPTTVSLLITDHWVGYKHLDKIFPQHEIINHAAHEYVIGAVHTNTIEGFFEF